jgi:hypothetical protein
MSITRKSGMSTVLAALWLCAPGSLPAQTFTTLYMSINVSGEGNVVVPVEDL